MQNIRKISRELIKTAKVSVFNPLLLKIAKMIKLLILSACIVSVLTAQVPPPNKNSIGNRIVGGEDARAGQFPWQAALNVSTATAQFFCGGALISDSWVLTAGQCTHNILSVTVSLGSNRLSGTDANRVVLSTSTTVPHPAYNPLTLENDIGLVRFRIPVSFTIYIEPIRLASLGQITENELVAISGWGQLNDASIGETNNLQYVDLVLISNTECQLSFGDQIKTNMVCAVGTNNEGICIGDSGSPLITTGSPYHVGVASFFSGNGCDTPEPSGYVRTDLYHNWISEVTGAL